MKLQMFTYTCEPLGHVFHAPELPFTSYGEFLLRDETGTTTAYLNGLFDPTYLEVGALLKGLPQTERLTASQRADVLQRLYGEVACNPDANGNPFIIGQHPKCPVCSSATMRSWDEAVPMEVVEVAVPPVSHLKWQSLTEKQKIESVELWLATNRK